MTVGRLLELLNELPKNATVIFEHREGDEAPDESFTFDKVYKRDGFCVLESVD